MNIRVRFSLFGSANLSDNMLNQLDVVSGCSLRIENTISNRPSVIIFTSVITIT